MGYGFYLAEVVNVSQSKDNRLGVRVIPHMNGIETSKCPFWPSFFKDELYTGKEGELVWVICDDEFSMGYVFGLANYNTYPDRLSTESGSSVFGESADGIALSIPVDLRNTMSKTLLSLKGLMLSLDNVKVTYWDKNCIHYIERSTGGMVIAYSSGSLYVFRQDEFIIKMGSSVLRMDAKSLNAVSDAINLQSESIGLGNSTSMGNVLVTNGSSAEGAYPSKVVRA